MVHKYSCLIVICESETRIAGKNPKQNMNGKEESLMHVVSWIRSWRNRRNEEIFALTMAFGVQMGYVQCNSNTIGLGSWRKREILALTAWKISHLVRQLVYTFKVKTTTKYFFKSFFHTSSCSHFILKNIRIAENSKYTLYQYNNSHSHNISRMVSYHARSFFIFNICIFIQK